MKGCVAKKKEKERKRKVCLLDEKCRVLSVGVSVVGRAETLVGHGVWAVSPSIFSYHILLIPDLNLQEKALLSQALSAENIVVSMWSLPNNAIIIPNL